MRFGLSSEPLGAPLIEPSTAAGAVVTFVGRVRELNSGREVESLEYEAYDELAITEGDAILHEAAARFPILDAVCIHRVGHLQLGDEAIRVEVVSGHRQEAFAACRWIVDEVKDRVPIWKKEHYRDGDSEWLNPVEERSAAEQRMYERQVKLAEVGQAGQAKLKATKVLVVGAGGLGCAALPYLAAAGIGTIGICDDDVVELENLHRQVLFGPPDLGRSKTEVAAQRCRQQNPYADILPIPERLTPGTAERITAGFDLLLDCTDNLATKFALNRIAVETKKPLIVAGIYRFEGQIQLVLPGGPCLECLWEAPPSDGCVGTCAEVGVLGAVPGVLGAIQAMECLKLVLGLASEPKLVLVDLLSLESSVVSMAKRAECPVCGVGTPIRPLELIPEDLRDFRVVDVREQWELTEEPLPWNESEWLPLSQWRGIELDERPVLLVCKSGIRTHQLAFHLREEGMAEVYSLPGGLKTLRRLVSRPS